MFDYVRRELLEAEIGRRIRAEAERDALSTQNTSLLDMLKRQGEAHEAERVRHHQEIATLLKHTAPIAPVFSEPSAETSHQVPMSLEEALVLPAVGHAQIQAKRNLMAQLRAAKKNGPPAAETSDDELNDAERERVAKI